MSIVMKNKLSATALAIAAIIGMGFSTMASAATADFSANVTIVSPVQCPIETTTPNGTEWDVIWTLDNLTDPEGTLSYAQGAPVEPLPIQVRFGQGAVAGCDLSGVKLKAESTVNSSQNSDNFFDQETNGGGLWRYAPVLAKVSLYTDDTATTAVDTTTNVLTVTDANGSTHTLQATPRYNAHNPLQPIPAMGSLGAVSLSNNYLDSNAEVPLAGGDLSSIALATATVVRAVDLDVSAIIASNPIDQNGAVDVQAVNNDDVVKLPFTVDIAYH